LGFSEEVDGEGEREGEREWEWEWEEQIFPVPVVRASLSWRAELPDMLHTEVCIVGAGPAGATLSHFLSKEKIPHVLIDKSQFPRDKVCGDGITVDVLNVLKRISPDFLQKFTEESGMQPSWGLCFHGNNGKELRFDFQGYNFKYAPFFTAKREHLDNFLIRNLPQEVCTFMPGTEVVHIVRDAKGVEVDYKNATAEGKVRAKIIVGAEGEKPIVTRHLGLPHYREKEHLSAGLRVYYKNIKGLHPGNHLEFYQDKRILPGYFWIFPLGDGEANVGLGMLSKDVAEKKVNLKKVLEEIITHHPEISKMFAEAEPLETTKGWGLPFITSARKIAGERYALIGDAGGMIEPLTGKGIGPGMMSARICAEHIVKALTTEHYDMQAYEAHMYRYYKREMTVGYSAQKISKYPFLFNSVVDVFRFAPIKKWAHSRMVKKWQEWM
jgi:geranylgeranyl reductase family protein